MVISNLLLNFLRPKYLRDGKKVNFKRDCLFRKTVNPMIHKTIDNRKYFEKKETLGIKEI